MRLVLPALFPLFSKIDVNGKNADPLFVYLKAQQGGFLGDDIKWNFTKFLVSRDGTVVDRYAPLLEPLGLTYTQYIAMMVMWEHKSISIRDMGKLLSSVRFVSCLRLSI